MYPQARDIDNIYRTEAFRPATAAELIADGTDLQAGIRSLAQITQDVRAAQPQEVLMSLRTRRGTYFNAYDSTGPVSAGHPQAHPDPLVSDEIFTLIDRNGWQLESGDRVVIRTRRGTYFNAWDSSGNVSASRLAYHPDSTVSDEIFTILLGETITHRAEVYHQLQALYQAVLGRAIDDSGWQTYSNAVLTSGWTPEQVRNDIAHSPEAYGYLEGIYQAVLGRAMDDSGKQTYSNALANGWTLGQVRNAIAHSAEAANALKALHQEVWGRPIDAAYLDYYTFLLSTDGTLAAVRADMKALHLQMVVLPVLIAISLIQ